MKKKILTCMIAFVMTVVMTLGLAGCSEGYLPEYENEYFRYAVRTNKDGTKEGYLIGFTELGAEQEYLILPQEIDGIPIVDIGYERQLGWGTETISNFINNKIEKLYVNFDYSSIYYSNCHADIPNCRLVIWMENGELSRHRIPGSKGAILGKKILEKNLVEGINNNYHLLANLSYLYNFGEDQLNNYYWVDSYDNSTVEFIPPEPTREGYEFGGWYKEPECENAWDFATDKTGNEIVIEAYSNFEDYAECNITYLYAKWIKEGETMK